MTLAGEHLSCQDEQMMEKKVQTQGAVFCIPVAGTVWSTAFIARVYSWLQSAFSHQKP